MHIISLKRQTKYARLKKFPYLISSINFELMGLYFLLTRSVGVFPHCIVNRNSSAERVMLDIKNGQLKLKYRVFVNNEIFLFLQDIKQKAIQHPLLKVLKLSYNNINDQGVKHLCSGPFENLASLYLDCNNITNKGVKYLCGGYFDSIVLLNLRSNRVGNQGAKALCLSYFQNLEELDLSCNNISSEGAKNILYRSSSNLKNINLNLNMIGNQGLKTILGSLLNLVIFQVNHNKIFTQFKSHIRSFHLKNKTDSIIIFTID